MLDWIIWSRIVWTFKCVSTNTILIVNWIVWNRTVWLNWIVWNRNVFFNETVYLCLTELFEIEHGTKFLGEFFLGLLTRDLVFLTGSGYKFVSQNSRELLLLLLLFTWNNISACKLFVLDRNTWDHITMSKLIITEICLMLYKKQNTMEHLKYE